MSRNDILLVAFDDDFLLLCVLKAYNCESVTDQCWYTYVDINSRSSLNKQPSLATRSENNERSVISHRAGGPDQAKTQLWGRFVKYHSISQPGTCRGSLCAALKARGHLSWRRLGEGPGQECNHVCPTSTSIVNQSK